MFKFIQVIYSISGGGGGGGGGFRGRGGKLSCILMNIESHVFQTKLIVSIFHLFLLGPRGGGGKNASNAAKIQIDPFRNFQNE